VGESGQLGGAGMKEDESEMKSNFADIALFNARGALA
jgi:hypothetical protein